MTVLTEKKKIDIAKHLSAIYYAAVHWNNNLESLEVILANVADVAFAVGGERMMSVGIPLLVDQLEQKFGNESEQTQT